MTIPKDLNGQEGFVRAAVDETRELLEAAAAEEVQLDMLEQPTPEEIVEAREELGENAGHLSVVRHARHRRGVGRPPGVRNRRTDDFERYIRSFGQDPAITMMQIQATPTEVLMEASTREVTRVVKDRLVTFNETMSYHEAMSLRIRCAEGLLPYVHSKKPVAIDARILGVRIVEEVGGHDVARDLIEGEAVRVARPDELPEDEK